MFNDKQDKSIIKTRLMLVFFGALSVMSFVSAVVGYMQVDLGIYIQATLVFMVSYPIALALLVVEVFKTFLPSLDMVPGGIEGEEPTDQVDPMEMMEGLMEEMPEPEENTESEKKVENNG